VLDACVIVPAYDAATTVGGVVDALRGALGLPIIVVDDGSTDATGKIALAHGADLLTHARNRGKGAALRTGLREAARRGFRVAITVDADGQHPAQSARMVLGAADDPRALVLGVRDLVRDGAPPRNRFGNRVSNFFLSFFSGRALRDTQCGLRRYPIPETLVLGTRSNGYAFEGEVVLRAVDACLPVVEIPVTVVYPPSGEGRSHFRGVIDPVKIVLAIASTVALLGVGRMMPRRRAKATMTR